MSETNPFISWTSKHTTSLHYVPTSSSLDKNKDSVTVWTHRTKLSMAIEQEESAPRSRRYVEQLPEFFGRVVPCLTINDSGQ